MRGGEPGPGLRVRSWRADLHPGDDPRPAPRVARTASAADWPLDRCAAVPARGIPREPDPSVARTAGGPHPPPLQPATSPRRLPRGRPPQPSMPHSRLRRRVLGDLCRLGLVARSARWTARGVVVVDCHPCPPGSDLADGRVVPRVSAVQPTPHEVRRRSRAAPRLAVVSGIATMTRRPPGRGGPAPAAVGPASRRPSRPLRRPSPPPGRHVHRPRLDGTRGLGARPGSPVRRTRRRRGGHRHPTRPARRRTGAGRSDGDGVDAQHG